VGRRVTRLCKGSTNKVLNYKNIKFMMLKKNKCVFIFLVLLNLYTLYGLSERGEGITGLKHFSMPLYPWFLQVFDKMPCGKLLPSLFNYKHNVNIVKNRNVAEGNFLIK